MNTGAETYRTFVVTLLMDVPNGATNFYFANLVNVSANGSSGNEITPVFPGGSSTVLFDNPTVIMQTFNVIYTNAIPWRVLSSVISYQN